MKKFILFSLSMLLAAGSMPVFGMGGEQQPGYRKAKKEAKRSGYLSGLGVGMLGGLGIVAAGFGIRDFIYGDKSTNGAAGILGFTGLAFASSYLFNASRKSTYAKIQNNQRLTLDQKSELKEKFKNRYRLTNALTSAAVVTTSLVAWQNKDKSIASLSVSALPQAFCTMFPAVLTGVAGWSWLTYSRPSKKSVLQQPV